MRRSDKKFNTLYCGWCGKPVDTHTIKELEEHHIKFNNIPII